MLTVVLGASTNTSRYSYMATERLLKNNYDVIPVGIKKGSICDREIKRDYPDELDIHTVALYLSKNNQEAYKQKILDNPPERVIFNPGTDNSDFEQELKEKGVNVVKSCVLVMLASSSY